jgi:4-hydroxybenzoate polyprenyltransferase
MGARILGHFRVVHPFPIALDAAVTVAIVLIAGAVAPRAALLGLGMLTLQASIGSLNDVIDADRDRGRKPGKPIAAGLVDRRVATVLAVGLAAIGLAIGWLVGPGVAFTGLAILAVGWSYDLWFKGTAWSWLPFAVGLPLLPVYAWLGATGELPATAAILVPAAAGAGSALAIANALVDTERDRAAGVTSIAAALGRERAWAVHVGLHLAVAATAVGGLLWLDRPIPIAVVGVGLPASVIVAGILTGRGSTVVVRERGWQLEALGTGLLAAAWLWLAVSPIG